MLAEPVRDRLLCCDVLFELLVVSLPDLCDRRVVLHPKHVSWGVECFLREMVEARQYQAQLPQSLVLDLLVEQVRGTVGYLSEAGVLKGHPVAYHNQDDIQVETVCVGKVLPHFIGSVCHQPYLLVPAFGISTNNIEHETHPVTLVSLLGLPVIRKIYQRDNHCGHSPLILSVHGIDGRVHPTFPPFIVREHVRPAEHHAKPLIKSVVVL